MLAENLVEEFEMKEDEPWYDHQDLQQGEGAVAPPTSTPTPGGRPGGRPPGAKPLQSCSCRRRVDARCGKGRRSPGVGTGRAPSPRGGRSCAVTLPIPAWGPGPSGALRGVAG